MEPHILDFDPHSGDFGLGFFGCSVQSGAYYVHHPEIGEACYLCNLAPGGPAGSAKISPVDLYKRRVYFEPLGLYVTLDMGTFESLTLNMAEKKIAVTFNPMSLDNITYSARRLRVDKLSESRPGTGHKVSGSYKFERGAFVVPEATGTVDITWE
jgi:hypothetical protein